MLISTRHKFIILSNRKCASTSLVFSLRGYCDGVFDFDHRIRHTSYSEYQRLMLPFLRHKVGDEVDTYDVYCLYRDPAEWMHSWYRFRTRDEISPAQQPGHWEYAGHLTWPEYLQEAVKKAPAAFANVGRQWEFAVGEDGTTKGLTLVRYEDMPKFLSLIEGRIGQGFVMEERNISPAKTADLTAEDIAFCRAHLARDYEIYDAIPAL